MFKRGWVRRAEDARVRQAERAEKEASPEYQAVQAARRAHREAAEREEAERLRLEREEREGPAVAVAGLLVDRLGDDLPEILTAITKAGGMAKVVAQLEKASSLIERERRAVAVAERQTAQEAQIAADRDAAMATRAARIARDRERAAEKATALKAARAA